MPDILGTILWPIRWVIELILVGAHQGLTYLGLDPTGGPAWVLSIAVLVLLVRAALIPVFVRQIKSQRKMLEVAPQLKKIQDKYKGKRDQFSREAMSRETMALYSKEGANPLSSCLPLLLQMPIFFGLYTVLNTAAGSRGADPKEGVGLMTLDLSQQFAASEIFGAPLHASFSGVLGGGGPWEVLVLAPIMVVLMTASQFITQLQIVSKNMSPEAKASPMFRQQRILLYILPLVFAVSGVAFPLGVMFYWLVSNAWTMAQQFIVIRNMPTPGSEAALAREARLARKQQRKGISIVEDEPEVVEEAKPAQRVQPVNNKNRNKRKKK